MSNKDKKYLFIHEKFISEIKTLKLKNDGYTLH